VKIGLIGYGTVGQGVAGILGDLYPGWLMGVARRRWTDAEAARLRSLGVAVFDNWAELIAMPGLEVIVEVINHGARAREIWQDALAQGLPIVSANKGLIASPTGQTLINRAGHLGIPVRYEAAVAGAIPILSNLRYNFKGDRILAVQGILNGTTNYILDLISAQGLTVEGALARAQSAGFAEADASLDLSGADSANKIAILARLAFNVPATLDQVQFEGIERISPAAIAQAQAQHQVYKLIASAELKGSQVDLRVAPQRVERNSIFGQITKADNLVVVQTEFGGTFTFTGPGAGSRPTASAIVNDIVQLDAAATKDTNNF
jgi:homoserine dehydrogenase